MREVEITLYLRDELLAFAMDRSGAGAVARPSDHFFGTASGRRRDSDRFRDRILARAVTRANANRAESGLAPLPSITPHSMRRSWATFCAMIGRDPKWVAAQIGHVNPKFTFSVYQQVATRRYIDEQAVWALLRFADEPAERVPAAKSRASSGTMRGDSRGSRRASSTVTSIGSMKAPRIWDTANDREAVNAVINPVARNLQVPPAKGNAPTRKPRDLRGFLRAAEGTRTLDLLHGKQTL